MEPDENVNHVRGNLLAMVLAEDLDPLSVDELTKRIAALEREIERCRARIERANSHRASADALFRS
ncbi:MULTISPECIES: DUF1192 domain-containing protein [Sphingomonas]|jgi:uncharacterized small protein (DUF1192 family)|uniref:DUF1192 domain-containing protein n=1 Tax=Sphingomonas hankookensis TaxID=563996 RepID=A0ABR5YD31_9SPHN|nr:MULTISPECIES: DUF1192 domain-containing protein [Sphingomonas]KZE15825.1 hypothetical protein AVT10_13370 [Sphingomonas hankookensis]PZT93084.1 MAG: DUF1192 domain-containing protein [Sphingomonas sp.]RSV32844.1 DUF1192 domain-containing protein [Sphingomonas sp. ABOLH]WCP73315.1 DUF1192 domain-containing protein [Sphingomonas hankookensis]